MSALEIPEVGIVPLLTNAAYHALEDVVSNSILNAMHSSPAHAFKLYREPGRPPREVTAAMLSGTRMHCAVLEPEQFEKRYLMRPPGMDFRTTAGRAWRDQNMRPGVEIVDLEDVQRALGQRDAILAVPELFDLLDPRAGGWSEVSAFWRDERTGLRCRCRPDRVFPLDDGRVILLDAKQTGDVSEAQFMRTCWNMGYHRQAVWYIDGYQQASGREVAAFLFGAVTNKYPYLADTFELDERFLDRGRLECRILLDRYAECLARDSWPLSEPGVKLLPLPTWAR